jgi:hypothetical protein
MAAIVSRLPFGLDRIVAPSLLGFAVINTCTFAADLALLTALHGGLRWPVPVSITLSYLAASALSYMLNRALNFRSHGAVAPQVSVYAGVVVVNTSPGSSGRARAWPPPASTTGLPGSWRALARLCTCTPPCAGWSSATSSGERP